uniref:Uncharacterized protein n=1 Tax=Oryza brachyantha TaxID=4533 RepID=J3N8C5_ORYBR
MEVIRKMPAMVNMIRFVDLQTKCEVVLTQPVASGGASSSMAGDESTQRKLKSKRATSVGKGASGRLQIWERKREAYHEDHIGGDVLLQTLAGQVGIMVQEQHGVIVAMDHHCEDA